MNLLSRWVLFFAVILSGCATDSALQKSAPASPPAPQATTAAAAAPVPGPLTPLGQGQPQSDAIALLSLPQDLWDRIRRGYAMPDLSTELVTDREQWYAARPDYILRMTERSRKYLFYIVEELERRKMPTELALLPFIESAFNPQAVSTARAMGMWQFMPATGKDFDLKQNVFRDDRRDIQASTRAALDYLQRLYNMFGDWHLALALTTGAKAMWAKRLPATRKLGWPPPTPT